MVDDKVKEGRPRSETGRPEVEASA